MASQSATPNKGWTVALAGLGVNLCLGVLYSWGAFQTTMVQEYGMTATQTQIPYMVACFIFATSMVPGGRLQDKIGPRKVIMLAGVFALIGLVLSSFWITPVGLTITFGIVFGLAMGYGYAAPTPAAVKWFGPHKRGLIAGTVVSGFGLAGLYISPLAQYLQGAFGLENTFIILGVAYGIIIVLLAQIIENPPPGYTPEPPPPHLAEKFAPKKGVRADWDYKEMLKTKQFYGLWAMFCIGTLAGLLIIGQLRTIGLEQAELSQSLAYWLISVYAIFNWAGRLGCGQLMDKIGARNTLLLMFVLQVVTFSLFATFVTAVPLFIGTSIVAFAFGGMLTLFPAITANYFGTKNLGVNYGLVFTAWGGGGVFGPLLGGIVRDATGTFNVAYAISAGISVIAVILALVMKPPTDIMEDVKEEETAKA